MNASTETLRRFRDEGSERDFAEFVRAHANLVWSVALRQSDGRRDLAEEAVQTVFTDVARMIRRLDLSQPLSGWLVRHTCLKCREARRSERRRLVREDKAHRLNTANGADSMELPTPAEFESAGPLVDEILASLPDADRQALVLRFYENRELRQVGAAIGVGEEAARKRVSRALERVRSLLARRGILTSSALLAGAMAAGAGQPMPADLTARIAGIALRDGAVPVSAWIAMKTAAAAALARSPGMAAVAAAALAAAVAVPVWQHHVHEREILGLRNQLALASVAPRPSPEMVSAPPVVAPVSDGTSPAGSSPPRDPLLAALAAMVNDPLATAGAERMRDDLTSRLTSSLSLTPAQADSLRQWTGDRIGKERPLMLALLDRPELSRILRQYSTGQQPDAADIGVLRSMVEKAGLTPENTWAEVNLTPDQQAVLGNYLEEQRTLKAEAFAGSRLSSLAEIVSLSDTQKDDVFRWYAGRALHMPVLLPEYALFLDRPVTAVEDPALESEEAFLRRTLAAPQFETWRARRPEMPPLPDFGPGDVRSLLPLMPQ